MDCDQLLVRISIDPKVCFGKPPESLSVFGVKGFERDPEDEEWQG